MNRITDDGDEIKFDLHKQRGDSLDSGFAVEPDKRVTASATRQWIYVPADIIRQGHRISVRQRGYKLPVTTPPATSLQEFIGNLHPAQQRLLTGLKLVHDNAVYWIRH
jgi:hypothetical protein